MRLVQLTPGAGAMFCGNCLRDNALVSALRELGHDITMVPLYLPLTLDEPDQSAGTPLFFGGINVYLEQHLSWYQQAPKWLHQLLSNNRLLKWAGSRASTVDPTLLGEMTFSMFQGATGRQAREMHELTSWLATQPKADAICLSNALLLGMAGELKQRLNTPVICHLQGEDSFLDSLSEPYRSKCWRLARECAQQADLFIAPSAYFARTMGPRLEIPESRLQVVWNGINLQGYEARRRLEGGPVVGYLARLSEAKGLDVLVEAFLEIHRRGRVRPRLCAMGYCGAAESVLVERLTESVQAAGLAHFCEFIGNPSREEKINRLKSFSVFSVPARNIEAFGLYVVEALAAGVPLVQPRRGAFPEILEAAQAGVLYEENETSGLAGALENLLLHPEEANRLGNNGRDAAVRLFSSKQMAASLVEALGTGLQRASGLPFVNTAV